MPQGTTIRGVPRSLAQDAWWLATEVTGLPGHKDTIHRKPDILDGPGRQRAIALVALLAIGDFLFWGHAPGLSIALFFCSIFAFSLLIGPQPRAVLKPTLLMLATSLPAIEYLQFLSVAFLITGLAISTAWARIGGGATLSLCLRTALRFVSAIPVLGIRDLISLTRQTIRLKLSPIPLLRNWALPLGGGLILASLLIEANPILDNWFGDLLHFDLPWDDLLERVFFWAGLGLLSWPFLTEQPVKAEHFGPFRPARTLPVGLNAISVRNALVLFNIMLAVQTLLDLNYLWAGASLPDGMTYATYAKRGAYPLLITALLAGAFALASRPFLAERRGLRLMVMLWLGQNVALTASSALRLSLYIDAYGLTYLRLHTTIWIAVVALGLSLTAWQIWRERTNLWLLLRCSILGLTTLYIACFINFAHIIARYNLSHFAKPDIYYICELGPTAAAAIHAAGGLGPKLRAPVPKIKGWRDWGLREWRVTRYLEQTALSEPAHEDPRR